MEASNKALSTNFPGLAIKALSVATAGLADSDKTALKERIAEREEVIQT